MNLCLQRYGLRPTGIAIVLVMLIGCAPKIPVAKFDLLAESSEQILNGTTETYTRIEKLQRRYVVETAGSGPLSRETFKPVIEGQSFDLVPQLHFRESVLDVLVKYTRVLQAFAKRDFESDVDKASEELAGSLKSLASRKAPDEQSAAQASGVLATVVNVVGREIVHKKRAEALRAVMDACQRDVESLARLIAGSNEKIKAAVNKMLDGIIPHANARRPPANNPARAEFDAEAARLMDEGREIVDALDTLDAAVKKVPAVHAEIRNMLGETPDGPSAVPDLVKEAQRVNTFYRSLK